MIICVIVRGFRSRNGLVDARGAVTMLLSLAIVCSYALTARPADAGLDVLTNKSANPWTSLLPVSSRNSLLDPSKLQISHQVVFSYYSGSAGKGDTGGLFLTRLRYPLSSPLTVDFTIGSSLSHSAARGFQSNELFLQNFSLRYAPNDKLLLLFMYNGVPYDSYRFPTR